MEPPATQPDADSQQKSHVPPPASEPPGAAAREEQGIPSARKSVSRAAPVSPAEVPVEAAKMPAITRAGVELAQRVLWISAGAILLFMLYLLAMELVVGHEVSSLFRLGQECRHSGAPFLMLARMEQFAHDLDQAQHDPAWVAPAGSLENARNVAASLALLPGMTLAQTGQLKECVELLSAVGDRASKLAPCESLLEAERKDAVQAESTAISVQMADDAATRLNDHRQSLHQFWLQAAQLVLLNLLLPVLTAILGYTFGARQEQKAP